MAKHPKSTVFIHNGRVAILELWANRKDGVAFCKVRIIRETTRFRVETNFLGNGQLGLSCPKTIELAVAGFENTLDTSAVVKLFDASNLSLREWIDLIGPSYNPQMKG